MTIYTELIGFVTSSVTIPIYAIGLTLFYYDARIRKEGFDVEWMMHRATPPAPWRQRRRLHQQNPAWGKKYDASLGCRPGRPHCACQVSPLPAGAQDDPIVVSAPLHRSTPVEYRLHLQRLPNPSTGMLCAQECRRLQPRTGRP